MRVTSLINAEHYTWGDGCDGWHLLNDENLSIIQEKIPAGKSEVKHYHNVSKQFFYILEGEGTMELPDKIVKLSKNEGIEIPPKTIHKFINESDSDVIFLVISSPESHWDRVRITKFTLIENGYFSPDKDLFEIYNSLT